MSFCQAINTYFGIVMTADKRIMTTVGEENTKTFLLTDYAKKLFLTKHGYGVSYCGDASIDNIPTEYYIDKYINELESDLSVERVTIILAEKIKNLKSNNCIIILVGGFYNGEAYVCSTNSLNPIDVSTNTTFNEGATLTVRFAGRNDVADKYYKTNCLAFDYKKFTLKDATQFLAYINYSVACELHFAQTPQDVSLDCNILVITEKMHYWTTGYENLIK